MAPEPAQDPGQDPGPAIEGRQASVVEIPDSSYVGEVEMSNADPTADSVDPPRTPI